MATEPEARLGLALAFGRWLLPQIGPVAIGFTEQSLSV